LQEKIEENPIKKACKDLGIQQKELAVYFGVTAQAVSDWATKRRAIPKNFEILINLIKSKNDYESLKRSIGIQNSH